MRLGLHTYIILVTPDGDPGIYILNNENYAEERIWGAESTFQFNKKSWVFFPTSAYSVLSHINLG